MSRHHHSRDTFTNHLSDQHQNKASEPHDGDDNSLHGEALAEWKRQSQSRRKSAPSEPADHDNRLQSSGPKPENCQGPNSAAGEPKAGDPVPPGTLGELTPRPDHTRVNPVYIGLPGCPAVVANATDKRGGKRVEISGAKQWLDGGDHNDGAAFAYMAASAMIGRHIPLQAEDVDPRIAQNAAGRTKLQAEICKGTCSKTNVHHWGGAIDTKEGLDKDGDEEVRKALQAVGFVNTGRLLHYPNDPHHYDYMPTPAQRRLVAERGAKQDLSRAKVADE